MFYGIPLEKQKIFTEALNSIVEIYGGRVYASDMTMVMDKSLTFTGDSKFINAFVANANNDQEKSLLWRLHVLTWAAQHVAASVEGDFVECGVFHGFSSAVVCKYLDFGNLSRRFFLYDTFGGLPEQTSTADERADWNSVYSSYDSEILCSQVQEKFSIYPNVQIVQGIIPQSFQEAVPEKIAYLHVDMNSVQAEILAIEELFPRMSPGAFLILDDFGWNACQGQAIAEIEFMERHGYKVLELPTGQGIVIKR